jgi:Mor family transcriptional regulator
MNNKYPELLRDLIDKASPEIAEKMGLSMEMARQAVFVVAEVIRKDWSGDGLYLPKGLAYEISRRDREMYRKFTGNNHAALAREYDLSVRQVYARIALVGEEEFKRKQCNLFEQVENA